MFALVSLSVLYRIIWCAHDDNGIHMVCVLPWLLLLLLLDAYEILNLKPNPGGAFETGSKGHLHDAVSLFQWVIPLVVMNVFELVPNR